MNGYHVQKILFRLKLFSTDITQYYQLSKMLELLYGVAHGHTHFIQKKYKHVLRSYKAN